MTSIIQDSVIKDSSGREIIKINDKGNIIIGRYVNMSDECKKYICEVYCDLTKEDSSKVMAFLNYESDEGEFCS